MWGVAQIAAIPQSPPKRHRDRVVEIPSVVVDARKDVAVESDCGVTRLITAGSATPA
jgi:hypothetical protein